MNSSTKKSLLPLLAATALLISTFATAAARAQDRTTQRFTATVNGAQISYTVTGSSGDTIVLIHGYPLNGDLFARQREALSAAYRVITVDLRGFGQSVAPDDEGSIDLYANDVLGLLDQLGVGQAIIGGHSMGGAITLRLYQMAPSRFLGMILNDAAVFPPPTVEQFLWRGYQQQARELGGASFLPLLLPEFLTGRTRTERPALVTEVSKQILAASVNGLVGGAHALETRPDLTPVFTTIAVPTLILYGQEDSLTPIEQANALNGVIPDSQLVIIPRATHGVVREAPSRANAAILRWLAAHFPNGNNPRTSSLAVGADE